MRKIDKDERKNSNILAIGTIKLKILQKQLQQGFSDSTPKRVVTDYKSRQKVCFVHYNDIH